MSAPFTSVSARSSRGARRNEVMHASESWTHRRKRRTRLYTPDIPNTKQTHTDNKQHIGSLLEILSLTHSISHSYPIFFLTRAGDRDTVTYIERKEEIE